MRNTLLDILYEGVIMSIRLSELKMPLILVLEFVVCLLWGDLIDTQVKSFFYAVSLGMKSLLMAVLPFIIFSFITGSICDLKKGSIAFVMLVFTMVVGSNFISTSLGGLVGYFSLQEISITQYAHSMQYQLEPLYDFSIPQLMSTGWALLIGVGVGVLIALTENKQGRKIIHLCHDYSLKFLEKGFIPLIPIFILGFILKMQHDGILQIILRDYLSIFLLISVFTFSYLLFLFGFATGFSRVRWIESLKNMIPAVLTGFSTMSSASALPLVVEAAGKTTKEPLSEGVAPISINIHLVGDCFFLSILALAILLSFGAPLPTIGEYMMFVFFFVLAKFSVAAVPGGGVIVMLPIMQEYLGFKSEMLSLIMALYILFDPVITAANAMGNGALAMIFVKFFKKLGLKKPV